jgi:hypothetical protein
MIDDAIASALMTVHAFAWLAVDAGPPLDVSNLDEAVRGLANVTDATAEWRRLQAIVKLAAADLARFRVQLRKLGAPTAEIGAALGAHPHLPLPDRELLIWDLLVDRFGPPFPNCRTRHVRTEVTSNPNKGTTTVIVRLEVNKSITALSRVLDPQTWERCSDFFANSYVARKGAGPFGYKMDSECVCTRRIDSPIVGTKWQLGLFEHFRVPWGIYRPSFQNVLKIHARPKAGGWRVDYRLIHAVCSDVVMHANPGVIEVDEGWTTARDRGCGWSELLATKTIKFGPQIGIPSSLVKFWTHVTLSAMGYGISRAICCAVRRAERRRNHAQGHRERPARGTRRPRRQL